MRHKKSIYISVFLTLSLLINSFPLVEIKAADDVWVIKPQYTYASDFNADGFAVVEGENGSGVIDKTGEIIVPLDYNMRLTVGFGDGKAVALNDSGSDVYDLGTGKELLSLFNIQLWAFSNGLAAFLDYETGKCGFMDINGNVIIPAIYDVAGPFKGDWAFVADQVSPDSYGNYKSEQMIDKSGNTILTIGDGYHVAYDLLGYEGNFMYTTDTIAVTNSGKSGIMNKNGEMIVPLEYSYIDISNGIYQAHIPGSDKCDYYDSQGNPVSQMPAVAIPDLIPKESDGKWGYIQNPNKVDNQNIITNDGDQNISVIINGNPVEFDQPPVIQNDRTLVPLRAIFEALNAQVDWDADTQTVTAQRGDISIKLQIGSDQLYINGKAVTLGVPAQIIGGRTMVPARAIAESFGADVAWDNETRTVTITS